MWRRATAARRMNPSQFYRVVSRGSIEGRRRCIRFYGGMQSIRRGFIGQLITTILRFLSVFQRNLRFMTYELPETLAPYLLPDWSVHRTDRSRLENF